jgi:uncharacterized protein
MPDRRPVTTGLFVEDDAGPRLLAARCRQCDKPHFPPGPVCPYCSADGCVETRVGPAARLWLYTVVATRPPGYQGEVPYGFGVVELEGGLRVITRLTEIRLDHLRAGMPMRLTLTPLHTDDTGATVVTYAFAPEER